MKTSLTQLTTGLVLVGIGVGFLLDNLNIINFSGLIGEWWPLLIIALGIVSYISNPRSVFFPLGAVVVGTLLQLRELDILTFSIGSLIWPAILIIVGLSIMFDRMSQGRQSVTNDETSSLFVALSGIETKNKSENYKGGKLTAMLGGITLDLRNASMNGTAQLDITAIMGGVELQVPSNWNVHVSGIPLMGGWEDKTVKPTQKNAPILNIQTTCIMGGLEIKN